MSDFEFFDISENRSDAAHEAVETFATTDDWQWLAIRHAKGFLLERLVATNTGENDIDVAVANAPERPEVGPGDAEDLASPWLLVGTISEEVSDLVDEAPDISCGGIAIGVKSSAAGQHSSVRAVIRAER